VHGTTLPSRRQTVAARPLPVSLRVNVSAAPVACVGSAGLEAPSIEIDGAVVSTVNERLAGVGSALPAVSVARTSKVWGPAPRPA